MKTYKIGIYKNGEHFAKAIFKSENLEDVKAEFIRMYEATDFCPEGTDNEPETSESAWEHKWFCEDTTNIAVFECNTECNACITNYTPHGMTSNKMK